MSRFTLMLIIAALWVLAWLLFYFLVTRGWI
jgi:hypothetical protein